MFNLTTFNYFLINLLFLSVCLLTIYREKFNFNKFLIVTLIYVPITFVNLLSIIFNNKKEFFLNFNIKIFFKPFFIDIFSIKITILENYFIFIISLISFFSNLLTFFYLNDDKKKKKFFLFLNFFSISMILFIIQNCIFIFILS